MSKREKFINCLMENSNSDNYDKALDEWYMMNDSWRPINDGDGECICSHPIQHEFFMTNKFNKNEIIVGSSCITKFMKKNKRIMNEYNVLRYNRESKKKDRLSRRCNTCNVVFKIHKIEYHEWMHECPRCYRNKKPKSIKPPAKKLHIYKCYHCEEPFIDIENLTCTIKHIGNVEHKIYRCCDC